MDLTSQTVTLKDGRVLGYAQYGDPKGKPLFFFHGWPGSRFAAKIIDVPAKKMHLRVIAPDRPGMGLSDFQKRRTFLDWPNDVAQLADAIHLKKISVMGVSGGAPFILACAYKIPDRLDRVGIVSGVGPFCDIRAIAGLERREKRRIRSVKRLAPFVGPELRIQRFLTKRFSKTFARVTLKRTFGMSWPECVHAGLDTILVESILESSRHGIRGIRREARLYMRRDWEIPFGKIQKEIRMWHGETDPLVPVAIAKEVVKQLPHCRTTYFPDCGHAPIVYYARDILKYFV